MARHKDNHTHVRRASFPTPFPYLRLTTLARALLSPSHCASCEDRYNTFRTPCWMNRRPLHSTRRCPFHSLAATSVFFPLFL
jgi:hypothetical protein